jgi:hypothetical protein
VAWGSPRTHVVLIFAVELIQNRHLKAAGTPTESSVSLRCCKDKLSASLDSCSVTETCRTNTSAIYEYLWVTLHEMFSATLQLHFSSREIEFIGRIVSREWKNVPLINNNLFCWAKGR